MARNPSFAPPTQELGGSALPTADIPNASLATPGLGLVVDSNGLVPGTVLAPTPTDAYVLVWNNTTQKAQWAQITSAGITDGTIANIDVSATAAIAYSKMANPGGTTTFLRADGTFVVPPAAVAPTHLPGAFAYGLNSAVVANTAYLIAIPNVVTATVISRIAWLLQTVVAGNYDVGIYSSTDDATFTRLVSKGSTAQPAGSNQNMISTVASTTLTPVTGTRFYYGIALSTASTIGSGGTAAHLGGFSGQLLTKATSFPLPASLTGMTTGTVAPAPVLNGMV